MNIYHIVDHSGFGTIHKLLVPLCQKYDNNKLFTPYLKQYRLSKEKLQDINNDNDCIVIIHSTGRQKTIYVDKIGELFPNKKVFIFMHVSVDYEKHKSRVDFLKKLKYVCDKYNIIILTPSKEVTRQYEKNGFISKTIQLGIDIYYNDDCFAYKKRLEKYYHKIITTCVCDNKGYYSAKGIDIFSNMIIKNKLENNALIAGLKDNESVICCTKFKEKDFLNILYHSLCYVQLSKFESYNMTAVFSKRFKIPVLLLKAEGNVSCMNNDVYLSLEELEKDLLKIVSEKKINYSKISKHYIDSVSRENLETFNYSLKRLGDDI